MEGVVDTGAVMLVLPEDVVGRFGLRTRREVMVAYANEYRETRKVAGPVTVQIGNRFMNADCIIGPPSSEPLIGQIVLEELDLTADCGRRTGTAPGVAGRSPAEAEVSRTCGGFAGVQQHWPGGRSGAVRIGCTPSDLRLRGAPDELDHENRAGRPSVASEPTRPAARPSRCTSRFGSVLFEQRSTRFMA